MKIATINKELFKQFQEKSGLDTLSDREKWVLFGGIFFVICFVLFQFVVSPFFEARNRVEKSIVRKEKELIKIDELRAEYLSLKNKEGSIQVHISKRERNFTLFTFLDQQAGKAEVKKQIKYMKPSIIEGEDLFNEAMVEMKLQEVTLESLVSFLRLIESEEKVVFIRRISIQESGDEQGYLDAILQVATFQNKVQK